MSNLDGSPRGRIAVFPLRSRRTERRPRTRLACGLWAGVSRLVLSRVQGTGYYRQALKYDDCQASQTNPEKVPAK